MSTILQNLGHECFETRHGMNPALIKLDDIEIGQVIPSSGIFDISLKEITIKGINNYHVQNKDNENSKFVFEPFQLIHLFNPFQPFL